MTVPSLRDAIQDAVRDLAEAGIADPVVDAELLAGFVLSQSRGHIQAGVIRGDELSGHDADVFRRLTRRRAQREPLQHITGLAPFRQRELQVGPGVFVPRPETELTAQFAIDALRADGSPSPVAVDLCTGSGAIAVAMATEVPHAVVYGAELSADAFAWAQRNADGIGNLTLVLADARTAFPDVDGTAAVVVSNPPYIPEAAVPRDPEVRLFDPALALYGGEDGLDVVRGISLRALALLRQGGTLILEHGEEQGAAMRELLTADGWGAAATHQDLSRRDRVTIAVRP